MAASEGIHGVVQRQARGTRQPITTTQFPQPPGMGATWDPELVRQAAGVEGYEARFITQTAKYDRQILMLWGPQSDLGRDPRWGRSEEVYGEDPFLQRDDGRRLHQRPAGRRSQVLAGRGAAQAFPGQRKRERPEQSSSNFDERLFWEYYSVPFRMGFVDGGAKAVMASYNAWNGTAMAINPILQEHRSRQVGRGCDFQRRRSREAAGQPAPSVSRSEGGGGRLPQGRHQPVS